MSAVAVQVLRLAGLLLEAGDGLAAPTGQTSARWRVLAAVEDAPATVATIARALGQARRACSAWRTCSPRTGWRVRGESDDRRAMLVRLTARGRSTLRAIQDASAAGRTRSARRWAIQLEAASATLARLTDALSTSAPASAQALPRRPFGQEEAVDRELGAAARRDARARACTGRRGVPSYRSPPRGG